MLSRFFPSKKIKSYRTFIEEHFRSIENNPPSIGMLDDIVFKEAKKSALKLSKHPNIRIMFDSDESLNPSFQALHTIFDVLHEMLYRFPQVDAGTSPDGEKRYCSAKLRDPLGKLNDEGKYLQFLGKEIVNKIVTNGFSEPDSEYIVNMNHLIDDATLYSPPY